MSSDLYIDGFPDSTRDYDKDSETIWIGHLGTCTYYGFHLTDKIHEYIHRDCLRYSEVKFLTDEQTGEIYSDYYNQLRGFQEKSGNDHSSCNQPMTVKDVEALVSIFDDLHQHWQHLNSLTDKEFDALGYGYMRPKPEKVKEDIFSGEEIRDSLLEFVGMYWNTRCD
jgi:hypothetical protein